MIRPKLTAKKKEIERRSPEYRTNSRTLGSKETKTQSTWRSEESLFRQISSQSPVDSITLSLSLSKRNMEVKVLFFWFSPFFFMFFCRMVPQLYCLIVSLNISAYYGKLMLAEWDVMVDAFRTFIASYKYCDFIY